jgi:TolB-like protein
MDSLNIMLSTEEVLMKNIAFEAVLAAGIFLLAISDLSSASAQDMRPTATALAEKMAAAGRKKVAVVDFTDLQGNVTQLGRFIAEELSIALADKAQQFEVIDRTSIRVILHEHKLASEGLIDPETARELGRIAGVDTLVSGTITPLGDSVHVGLKALDAESAKVIVGLTIEIPRTNAVNNLLGYASGTNSSNLTTIPNSSSRPPVPGAITEKNYKFDLQSCTSKQGEVICRLLVTNVGDDRRLWIEASSSYQGLDRKDSESQLFDNLGNGYIAKSVKIANDRAQAGSEWHEFPNGVATPVQLVFQGVAPEATSIGLLQIMCSEYGSGGHQIRIPFREIPVEK